MKKYALLFLICFIAMSSAWSVQTVEIDTYDVLPPYAFRNEKGELTGVYIDIVRTAVSRMPDYSVSFRVVPWSRAKERAKRGEVFAILPPYFHAHDWLTDTEPSRPYLWPYSLPLLTQYDIVVCNERKLQSIPRKYPEDYQGLSFVMWRGDGRAGEKFDSMVREKKISLLLVDSIKETIPLLLIGRSDCTVTSRLPFHWYVAQLKRAGEYEKYSRGVSLKEVGIISANEGYLGYTDVDDEANFPFKKDFSIKFDIEIFRLKRSGKLREIITRYVDHTDEETRLINDN
jgi:polar amino acid transport system substrate-binding protein